MNPIIREKTDLMMRNYYELKSNLRSETNLTKHFCAMVYSTRGRMVNSRQIDEVKKYIKQQTGFGSYFRGTNSFILASLLSLEEDYKSFFSDMQIVYDRMRNNGFKNSTQLPLAAYTLVKETDREQWNYKIGRMRKFYDNMKENHFWLTSADDYVLAAVLAGTDLEVEPTTRRIEDCYQALNKKGFYKGNYLQTLSHILAIGEEETEMKSSKAERLYYKLADVKCKLQYSGLATLGVLTLIAADEHQIVKEIKEVYDYLYEKDGYGFWSLDKNMRTIMSATIVSDFYVDEIKRGVLQIALGNSISAIIIAQQQAAVAAICAASASTAASSS